VVRIWSEKNVEQKATKTTKGGGWLRLRRKDTVFEFQLSCGCGVPAAAAFVLFVPFCSNSSFWFRLCRVRLLVVRLLRGHLEGEPCVSRLMFTARASLALQVLASGLLVPRRIAARSAPPTLNSEFWIRCALQYFAIAPKQMPLPRRAFTFSQFNASMGRPIRRD
jgi:hypothetical protein